MRNREQIYGQEAAELLRNITVYHCIRRDQLLRLYPGKEGVIENLLRYLVKQQRIFYNTDRDCYGDVPDCREDRELTAALWVLLDFIERWSITALTICRQSWYSSPMARYMRSSM